MSYANRLLTSLLPLLAAACAGKPAVRASGPVLAAPAPASRPDPQVVTFDGAPGSRFVAAGAPGRLAIRLRIGTRDLGLQARPRINLALIMDTSGSMEGKPMTGAIAAGLALLDSLKPGDRLAVVTFGSDAQVIVPSTVLNEANTADIKARIEGMKASGTTDMAAGLTAGLEQVYAHVQADGVNRVVLLGDGMPNDEGPILPLAQNAGARGVSITALGLGIDYNETLMAAIAQQSGGRFHYIADSDQIAAVFVDEVLRLTRTVARELTLALRPGPGVRIARVIGQPPGSTYLHLGQLAQGETRDVIVELDTPARKDEVAIELLDVDLMFADAVVEAGELRRHVYVATHATDDAAAIAGGQDGEVLRVAARQSLAAAVLEAIALARQGRLAEAGAVLDRAEAAARAEATARPDPALDEAIAELPPLRASLPSLVQQQMIQQGVLIQPDQPEQWKVPANAPEIVREQHEEAIRGVSGP